MTNKKSEKNVNVIEYVPKDVRLEKLVILEGNYIYGLSCC